MSDLDRRMRRLEARLGAAAEPDPHAIHRVMLAASGLAITRPPGLLQGDGELPPPVAPADPRAAMLKAIPDAWPAKSKRLAHAVIEMLGAGKGEGDRWDIC